MSTTRNNSTKKNRRPGNFAEQADPQPPRCEPLRHLGVGIDTARYQRRLAAGDTPQIAWGYCMTKLLRQVFGIWTSGTAFDPQHEAKESEKTETSGHKDQASMGQVVTEAPASLEPVSGEAGEPLSIHSAPKAPAQQASSESRRSIDYRAMRDRVTFDQVLGAIGQPVSDSSHHRGPCPLHEPESSSGRSFSVNLKRNLFRCFDSACRAQGNVLEFWMAYRQLPLYEAAEDLARTLRIELPTHEQPAPKTKKTKGKNPAGITPPSP
ncbi:MAG: hypothetical protein HC814_03090 [Rhodobacteraceae bacterium]|nr:hypothetical protein [Paracoccaceae bacterium]